MIVRDVMNPKVIIIKPNVSVKDASKLMNDNRIGSLIVVEKKKTRGILTERNILTSVAEGKDCESTTVEEIMSTKVVTIDPDKTIEEAVELMTKNNIKKLPVVEDDKLIGIITASDIAVVEPKLIQSIAGLISLKLPGYHGG